MPLCPECGGPLRRDGQRSRPTRVYCSRKCLGQAQSRQAEAHLNLSAFVGWSSEMAYALGLFFSDGSLQPQKGSWSVRFYNSDWSTIQWWQKYLQDARTPVVRLPGKQAPVGANGKKYITKKTSWVAQVSSRTLGEQLFALGAVPRKSFQPIRVPQVPAAYLPCFLRGLFDGDGSIYTYKGRTGGSRLSVEVLSNSEPFRQDLVLLLEAAGIRHPAQHGISVRMCGGDAERFCRWIYSLEGPRMSYKYERWLTWQEMRAGVGGLICMKEAA